MTAASAAKNRRAERLDDPAYEKLRTPGARRGLVLGLAGLLVVEAAAFGLLETLGAAVFLVVVAVVLIAFVLGLGMLKLSTRGVEELPDSALDERQRQVRGAVYVRAYRIGQVLLGAELLVAFGWWLLDLPTPGDGLILGALLLPFHVAIVLPTMIAAWSHDA